MPRIRTLLTMLAIAGVLVHAALLVRHGSMMLQRHAADLSLTAALAMICHGNDEQASPSSSSNLPEIPPPSDGQRSGTGDCPLCSGMTTAAAIPSEPAALLCLVRFTSLRIVIVSETIADRMAARRPPARAPPLQA